MAQSDNTGEILKSFEQARESLPGTWLAETRTDAIGRFREAGFPTPRDESWKYTNLRPLTRSVFHPLASVTSSSGAEWSHMFVSGADRIVIRNGAYDANLSSVGDLPNGVVLQPLSVALETGQVQLEGVLARIAAVDDAPLVALNTAFIRDGLALILPKGVKLARPVQVLHVVECSEVQLALHPRSLIVAGDNASATVIETFAGADDAAYWTNSVTETRLGKNASIRLVKRQSENIGAYHTALCQVSLDRDARFYSVALAVGAALSRNETKVSFNGAGADCTLAGGALLRRRQHADNTTEADHRVAHTTSNQVFRNVLDDQSRSVFQGGVIVQQDAQKTDSSQSNRNLLLSPGAHADAKPELRIFADDVKCAHGATVGDLDREALFYLQSRGIPVERAKALLIEAFIGEVLEQLPEGVLRDHVGDAVSGWMDVGEGA